MKKRLFLGTAFSLLSIGAQAQSTHEDSPPIHMQKIVDSSNFYPLTPEERKLLLPKDHKEFVPPKRASLQLTSDQDRCKELRHKIDRYHSTSPPDINATYTYRELPGRSSYVRGNNDPSSERAKIENQYMQCN